MFRRVALAFLFVIMPALAQRIVSPSGKEDGRVRPDHDETWKHFTC